MPLRRCVYCGGPITERIGTLKNQLNHIRGRSITIRGVTLGRCRRCKETYETYTALSVMLDLLLAHPKKRVVTWHPKAKRWT